MSQDQESQTKNRGLLDQGSRGQVDGNEACFYTEICVDKTTSQLSDRQHTQATRKITCLPSTEVVYKLPEFTQQSSEVQIVSTFLACEQNAQITN